MAHSWRMESIVAKRRGGRNVRWLVTLHLQSGNRSFGQPSCFDNHMISLGKKDEYSEPMVQMGWDPLIASLVSL